VAFVFSQKLELLHEAGQAVEYGQFPQRMNFKCYLSGFLGRNLRRCQIQTPPDHVVSTGSELLQV
jgi:hypothetical protein